MRRGVAGVVRVGIAAALLLSGCVVAAAEPFSTATGIRVTLLGTQSGPTFGAQRIGISTLVEAGGERLLFDAGRGATAGMVRVAVNPVDVTKVFLTHLHSDHVISLPELLVYPWAQGRRVPLEVWGPSGTRSMMDKFASALAYDIHVRRDVDEKFPAAGVSAKVMDIREGVVYQAGGVKVTAFLVDHSPVRPAFGYRIDFAGHAVALSGDTKPSENLVKAAAHVDLLIHEVGRWKGDPAMNGAADDLMPNSRQTKGEARIIAAHHTDGVELGGIFDRVQPKLGVVSHYNVEPRSTLALVRQRYAGPVEFGEDSMTIEIGDEVTVRRATAAR